MKRKYRIIKIERYHESTIFQIEYRVLFFLWRKLRELGEILIFGSNREAIMYLYKLDHMKPKTTVIQEYEGKNIRNRG